MGRKIMKKVIKQNIAVTIIQIIIFMIILFFSFRHHVDTNAEKTNIIREEQPVTQKDF